MNKKKFKIQYSWSCVETEETTPSYRENRQKEEAVYSYCAQNYSVSKYKITQESETLIRTKQINLQTWGERKKIAEKINLDQ